MKLRLLQEELSKVLSLAFRFTSSKIQLPVLANVLLSASKGKFTIKATNLEASISAQIGAKVDEDGEITIPAKTFYEVITNIPAGQVNISTDKEKVLIEGDGFKTKLLGMNSSDFPKIPENIDGEIINISVKEMSEAFSKTSFCISSDDTRPVLTGVLVKTGESLSFVATDGFRLSQKVLQNTKSKSESLFIIPRATLTEVVKVFSDEETLSLGYKKAEKQLMFGSGNKIVVSRVIDGSFPDYERIIPTNTKITVEIDREDLLRSIKLSGVFAKDAANVVKLTIGKSFLNISSDSTKSGSQEVKVDAKVEGTSGDFEIAFNFRFLEEFLVASAGGTVLIKFTDPNSSALFLDSSDKNYLHIIMPVKL